MSYNLTTMQSIFYGQSEIVEITHNNSKVYQKSGPGPDYTEPFYVQNTTNESQTVRIFKGDPNSSPTLTDVQYSTDKTNWSTFPGSTADSSWNEGGIEFTLAAGSKIYLRSANPVWNRNRIMGMDTVGGNIMSLIYGSNFDGTETTWPTTGDYVFSSLFAQGNESQNKLVNAHNLLLPGESIGRRGYGEMFYRCPSLVHGPAELPATYVGPEGYYFMFCESSNLETAPDVIAFGTHSSNSLGYMFFACTKLSRIKCLHAGANSSYRGFTAGDGWPSTGTFVKLYGSTWSTGEYGVPNGWTVVDDETYRCEIVTSRTDETPNLGFANQGNVRFVNSLTETTSTEYIRRWVLHPLSTKVLPSKFFSGSTTPKPMKMTFDAGISFSEVPSSGRSEAGRQFENLGGSDSPLRHVILPPDLTKITRRLFRSCQNLELVEAPATVTEISVCWPFWGAGTNTANKLTLVLRATTPPTVITTEPAPDGATDAPAVQAFITGNPTDYVAQDLSNVIGKLQVPASAVATYKADSIWGQLGDRIEAISE